MEKLKIVAISIFMALVFVPALLIDTRYDVVSESENRVLANFPSLHNEDSTINLNFTNEFDDWFNDHVGLRDEMLYIDSFVKYYLFRVSSTPSVHAGKNGWLYCTDNNNLNIVDGTYPLRDDDYKNITMRLDKLKKELNDKEIQLIVLLIPSKTSIYPEYLYTKNDVTITPVDILEKCIKENSDINVINPKQTLLNNKNENLLYFKTDTHWNQHGAYLTYKELVKELNKLGLTDTKPIEAKYQYKEVETDLNNHIKCLNGHLESMPVYGIDNYPEEFTNSEILNAAKKIIWDYPEVHSHFKNKNVEKTKILLAGDSFAVTFEKMLSQNCNELVRIWPPDHFFNTKILEIFKPDVVIFEVTERYIQTLKLKHDYQYIDDDTIRLYYYPDKFYSNVRFAVWSDENGQDDLIWYPATKKDNYYYVDINTKKHLPLNNVNVHIYGTDENGTKEIADNFVIR